MGGPSNATKQITHVNGSLIIAREPATGPHPRTRIEGSPYKGIEKVLLEDGTEAIICSECGWVGESTVSVSSHRTAAHIRTEFRRYPEATLRALIREVNRAKKDGTRGSAQRAAEVLNGQGITTVGGKPWTPDAVSHIYNDYKDLIRVRVPQARTEGGRPNGKSPANPVPSMADGLTVKQEVDMLVVLAGSTLDAAHRLAEKVDQPQVDPAVVEKAKKWDEFEKLMGRSSG